MHEPVAFVAGHEGEVRGRDGEGIAFCPQDESAEVGPVAPQQEEGIIELPADSQRPPPGPQPSRSWAGREALDVAGTDEGQRGCAGLLVDLDPEIGVGEATLELLAA